MTYAKLVEMLKQEGHIKIKVPCIDRPMTVEDWEKNLKNIFGMAYDTMEIYNVNINLVFGDKK